MPKERRDSSLSFERSRASPYPRSSKLPKNSPESEENTKEWEEARCPVCMEHPHNAVLLICSSHEKGCRPYMCDTSYRHSNCFDQFRKSSDETHATIDESEPPPSQEGSNHPPSFGLANHNGGGVGSEEVVEGSSSEHPITIPCDESESKKLVCPLCRGPITGWIVVESARSFMNGKMRSCASETCEFSGTYKDLRKHARLQHPSVRPSEADPERQRDWRLLERQRDFGDLISTLQSSMGDDRSEDSGTTTTTMLHDAREGWLHIFFFFRIMRPITRLSRSSSSWPRRGPVTARRRSTRHWGETYDGETGSVSRGDDDTESSDSGGSNSYGGSRRRVRRRTTPDNDEL